MYASGDIGSPTIYVSSDGGANWTGAAAAPGHATIRMRGYIMSGGVTRTYGAVPEEGIVSNPSGNTQFNYHSAGITGAVGVAVRSDDEPARVRRDGRRRMFRATGTRSTSAGATPWPHRARHEQPRARHREHR